MYFGVDYYPEHWPKDRWELDAKMMKDAGVNIVRLAEFAWSEVERTQGTFDFAWLDEALDVLARYDIKVMMGTPTSNAPMWLFHKYPECRVVSEDGTLMVPGGRYNACHNHTAHRQHAVDITAKMAEHYAGHNQIVGWHIHNEFGSAICYCGNCQTAFQEWLKNRYTDLDSLNAAWGSVFWSMEVTDWAQIPVPTPLVGGHSPSLALDYHRFCSDSVVEFAEDLLAPVRQWVPDTWILTNCQNFFKQNVDYYDLNRKYDVVATNNYPSSFRSNAIISAGLDLMRGIKDEPFWVVEQRSGMPGSVELGRIGRATKPGELRLWTYQAVGRGADNIVYFRWRTALFGQEQYWHGVLEHHGQKGRLYEEMKATKEGLDVLAPLLENSRVEAQVAMLHSYDQRWATALKPAVTHYEYQDVFLPMHEGLQSIGAMADIVPYDRELTKYKVVVAPVVYLVDHALAARLQEYVRQGGTVLFTFRSGVKNWNNVNVADVLPGAFADLCGISIRDYDCLDTQHSVALRYGPHSGFRGMGWVDVLSLGEAEPIAWYESEFYAGSPAITVNSVGQGKVYYMGTMPETKLLQAFLLDAVKESGGALLFEGNLPSGVEAVKRSGPNGGLTMLLNHNDTSVAVPFSTWLGQREDLLTGQMIGDLLTMKPKQVVVLRSN